MEPQWMKHVRVFQVFSMKIQSLISNLDWEVKSVTIYELR